ncbi:MAG: hypothetical protein AB7F75_11295, partial [Planctomycetota bacterium]
AFCRVCNVAFEEAQLEDGACATCRELKSRPHATHAVFKSEDLAYEGRRPLPWAWLLVSFGLLAFGLFLLPVENAGITLEGAKETTADLILEGLSEHDEDFVRELVSAQEAALFDIFQKIGRAQASLVAESGSCQTLEALHQSHVVNAHWMEGGDRLYTLSISPKGGDYELRARPEPPYTRHFLMQADGRVHMNAERPATTEDPVYKRLTLTKKKP